MKCPYIEKGLRCNNAKEWEMCGCERVAQAKLVIPDIPPELRVAAEQLATASIYQLRLSLTHASPELKLLVAKALLAKVRTMVEDLEQGVINVDNSKGNSIG